MPCHLFSLFPKTLNAPLIMNKNLLVFTSTFPRWQDDTIPPFIYELSKRLTENFDVSVLTPDFPGAKRDEVVDEMKVHRFGYFIKKYETLANNEGILNTLAKNKWNYLSLPFFMLGEFWALKKQIEKNRPDVIHAHWIIPQGFVCALMKKIYGVEYVVTAHGGDIFGLRGKLPTAIKRFTLRNAKKTTAVSSAIKKEILDKIGPDLEIEVISMGVDSDKFHPDAKDNSIKNKYGIGVPFLLFVGRLAEKKGVGYLIEAMPAVIERYPEAKLLIIGSGPLEEMLKARVEEMKLENDVVWVGAVPNAELPKYYATADIFVAPSIEAEGGDKEGLPVTLMEAMSSGCAVVASDLEGNKDLIEDGKNGFLVRQKNSRDISEMIIGLMDGRGKVDKTKEAGRKAIRRRFDWRVIGERYERILG